MTDQRPKSSAMGFGLVEVLVAMALLMVISLSMLPIFVSALRLSEKNIALTTSTQLVSEQMDVARGLPPTCESIQEFSAETVGMLIADPRGTVLEIHRSSNSTCPGTYPAAFTFTAWVTVAGEVDVLAEAETRIHIVSEE